MFKCKEGRAQPQTSLLRNQLFLFYFHYFFGQILTQYVDQMGRSENTGNTLFLLPKHYDCKCATRTVLVLVPGIEFVFSLATSVNHLSGQTVFFTPTNTPYRSGYKEVTGNLIIYFLYIQVGDGNKGLYQKSRAHIKSLPPFPLACLKV